VGLRRWRVGVCRTQNAGRNMRSIDSQVPAGCTTLYRSGRVVRSMAQERSPHGRLQYDRCHTGCRISPLLSRALALGEPETVQGAASLLLLYGSPGGELLV